MNDHTHFHLGAEAAPEFDPIAALAAEGIAAPEPVQLPAAPDYSINTMEDFFMWLSDQPPEGGKLPVEQVNPDILPTILFGEGNLTPVAPEEAAEILSSGSLAAGINPKDALGMKKPDLSVVPPAAELHLASAMMDGARKYGAFNWRDNAVLARVYIAAARRHLLQFLDGENIDPTSGVHHLGHAMACCAIILDAQETGNLSDDRPKPGAAGDMIRRWSEDTKFAG